jgi:hypothetical protein
MNLNFRKLVKIIQNVSVLVFGILFDDFQAKVRCETNFLKLNFDSERMVIMEYLI